MTPNSANPGPAPRSLSFQSANIDFIHGVPNHSSTRNSARCDASPSNTKNKRFLFPLFPVLSIIHLLLHDTKLT